MAAQPSLPKLPKLEPHPGMQTLACLSDADELLLGGQAGPGKSWVLLFMDLLDMMSMPHLRTLTLRRETPDLGRLIEMAREMYCPLGARFYAMHPYYRKAAFVFPRFTPQLAPIRGTEGAVAVFGHCQRETDKEAYSGFEFQRLRFDEVQQFTESMYLFLFSRLRTAVEGTVCNVRASCNPNGIGMLWLKRRFVDKLAPGEVKWFGRDPAGGEMEVPARTPRSMSRQWLPGDRAENTSLDLASYERSLSALGASDYRALALGLWEMPRIPQQMVDPEWWDAAVSGKVSAAAGGASRPVLGADFGHGSDDSVVAWGTSAGKLMGMESFCTPHGQEFCSRVHDRVLRLGSPDSVFVGIDSNGPGAVAADLLEAGFTHASRARERLPNLERCVLKDRRYDQKYRGAIQFPNLRAQMLWKLREDLREGKLDLSWLSGPDLGGFEGSDKLAEEVLVLTFSTDDGMVEVKKKREIRDGLGRSTDRLDALAIWNWVREFGAAFSSEDRAWERLCSIDPYMRNFREEMEAAGSAARRTPSLA